MQWGQVPINVIVELESGAKADSGTCPVLRAGKTSSPRATLVESIGDELSVESANSSCRCDPCLRLDGGKSKAAGTEHGCQWFADVRFA
jgi:hypothetical protein